jgi:hypothetical protein
MVYDSGQFVDQPDALPQTHRFDFFRELERRRLKVDWSRNGTTELLRLRSFRFGDEGHRPLPSS